MSATNASGLPNVCSNTSDTLADTLMVAFGGFSAMCTRRRALLPSHCLMFFVVNIVCLGFLHQVLTQRRQFRFGNNTMMPFGTNGVLNGLLRDSLMTSMKFFVPMFMKQ